MTLTLEVPVNLADAQESMPRLWLFNHSPHAIQLDVFGHVPFTHLEPEHQGQFVRGDAAICGNGFVPRRVAAGRGASFALWSRLDHGPGQSGRYRIALPYVLLDGMEGNQHEALSEPFELAYGDVAPAGWVASHRPGPLALIGAESSKVDEAGSQSHTPRQLAALMQAELEQCITEARKTLPWIRGRFSLVAYRYPNGDKPVTFVDTSLLGHRQTNDCLAAVEPPPELLGKFKLTFAVAQPLAVP